MNHGIKRFISLNTDRRKVAEVSGPALAGVAVQFSGKKGRFIR